MKQWRRKTNSWRYSTAMGAQIMLKHGRSIWTESWRVGFSSMKNWTEERELKAQRKEGLWERCCMFWTILKESSASPGSCSVSLLPWKCAQTGHSLLLHRTVPSILTKIKSIMKAAGNTLRLGELGSSAGRYRTKGLEEGNKTLPQKDAF